MSLVSRTLLQHRGELPRVALGVLGYDDVCWSVYYPCDTVHA